MKPYMVPGHTEGDLGQGPSRHLGSPCGAGHTC